jgi:energy-coupling factor transporter ATP-binding protein EcfA2
MSVTLGPTTIAQFQRLALTWNQGDHVLVTGPTNSGKTELARLLDEIRIQRGGHVVCFVCKLQPDSTITESYKGWTRWTTWKKRVSVHENRVLFWPKVEGLNMRDATALMKYEFGKALDEISKVGRWTVHIDEGLFVTSPAYLGLAAEIGMMYGLIRSAKGTMITLAQRPSHLPLSLYANISHAFVGRASEQTDLRRLADMDGTNSRELAQIIKGNNLHDFTWVQLGSTALSEQVNLAR